MGDVVQRRIGLFDHVVVGLFVLISEAHVPVSRLGALALLVWQCVALHPGWIKRVVWVAIDHTCHVSPRDEGAGQQDYQRNWQEPADGQSLHQPHLGWSRLSRVLFHSSAPLEANQLHFLCLLVLSYSHSKWISVTKWVLKSVVKVFSSSLLLVVKWCSAVLYYLALIEVICNWCFLVTKLLL